MAVAGDDFHFLAQIAGIEHAECGDDLLGAGHRASLIDVLGVEDTALVDIHHDRAFGEDGGRFTQWDIGDRVDLVHAVANGLTEAIALGHVVASMALLDWLAGDEKQSKAQTAGNAHSSQHGLYLCSGRRIDQGDFPAHESTEPNGMGLST